MSWAGQDGAYTVWGGVMDLEIPISAGLVIALVDDDRDRPQQKEELILACAFFPVEGKHIRNGNLSCTENGATIEAFIELPHDERAPEEPPLPQP